MFNYTFYTILMVLVLCEGYRIAIQCNYGQLVSSQKIKLTSKLFTFQILVVWLFFNMHSFRIYEQTILVIFLSASICFFCAFLEKALKKNLSLFFLLNFAAIVMYKNFNLVSFIFISELLSLTSFFFLFLNNTQSVNKKRFSVVYFVLTNIFIFFFGILLSIVILKSYGTGDVNLIVIQSQYKPHSFVNAILFVYITLKLGQGPLNFLKFKFYKSANIVDLIYYIFIYIIMVWPFFIVVSSTLFTILPANMTVLLLATVTVMFLQTIFLYKTFIDFLVFSTWAYSLYIFIFLMGIC